VEGLTIPRGRGAGLVGRFGVRGVEHTGPHRDRASLANSRFRTMTGLTMHHGALTICILVFGSAIQVSEWATFLLLLTSDILVLICPPYQAAKIATSFKNEDGVHRTETYRFGTSAVAFDVEGWVLVKAEKKSTLIDECLYRFPIHIQITARFA
jgi:hypothetical protein